MIVRSSVLTAIALALVSVVPAVAQEVVADVETWRGGTIRIARPVLDALYTIPGEPAASTAPGPGTGLTSTTRTVQSSAAGGGPKEKAPPPVDARRQVDVLTFFRDNIEIRVPFDRITGLAIDRRDVVRSHLPPYVSPAPLYSAKAVLVDGSIVEATMINFGTTVLRGMGPQGTIELPLEDVKTLKITR